MPVHLPTALEAYKGEQKKSDASLFPSYTHLTIPYRVICRQRYARTARIQKKQFLKEHRRLELIQVRALDGVRIHREFCDNILVGPDETQLIKLKPKQIERLDYLLKNVIE